MADANAIKTVLTQSTDAETGQLMSAMEVVRQLPDGLSSDDPSLQSVIDALYAARSDVESFLS